MAWSSTWLRSSSTEPNSGSVDGSTAIGSVRRRNAVRRLLDAWFRAIVKSQPAKSSSEPRNSPIFAAAVSHASDAMSSGEEAESVEGSELEPDGQPPRVQEVQLSPGIVVPGSGSGDERIEPPRAISLLRCSSRLGAAIARLRDAVSTSVTI